jgi:dTDP-4-dehydrorhamnose 3,5-epimerase
MIFSRTPLSGAFVVEPSRIEDDRGFFARIFEPREFEAHGLNPRVAQCSLSFNPRKGTLRGMHYQRSPFEEAKLVRCTRGAIHDVMIDLRPTSATFRHHFAVVLDADSRRMLYIPEGFAHGFLTLTDDAEVSYQMSQVYSPEHAAGVRWNDPAFGIPWPGEVMVIAERDRTYPDFRP